MSRIRADKFVNNAATDAPELTLGINFGASGVGGTITATGQAEFAGVVTATSFVGSGANLTGVISGVELESEGNSVGTAITNINFVHTGDITTGSGGITTVTTWEVFDTWLYGGG